MAKQNMGRIRMCDYLDSLDFIYVIAIGWPASDPFMRKHTNILFGIEVKNDFTG